MLRDRIIFGAIFIATLFGFFWLDARVDHVALTGVWKQIFNDREYLPSGMVLLAFSIFLITLAAGELASILRANEIRANTMLTCAAAYVGLLLHFSVPTAADALLAVSVVATALVVLFLAAIFFYSRGQNVEGVVAAAGGTMFAAIYLGFLFGFLLAMRRWESAWIVLAILAITKSCDVGAYFTGRAIGKHRLIPWLSPGKTWEGLAGGVLASTIVASLLAIWGRQVGSIEQHPGLVYDFAFSPLFAAAAGASLGLVGQAGDLLASLLKRDAGLKDSSSLLPGFGGVLDVLDSPLLVAPLAYWLLVMRNL